MRRLSLIVVLAAAAGCRNPCQQVCVEMRKFAEDCGYEVDKDEFKACLDGQKKPSDGDKAFCRDFGDQETIAEEWLCEDLAIYWAPGGGTTGGTTPQDTSDSGI